jgi:hypothetical protein
LALLPFDVSVTAANKLSQYHVKALVPAPRAGQVSKGSTRRSGENENLHPYEFALPSFELCGRVVNGEQASGAPFFISVPSGRLLPLKA